MSIVKMKVTAAGPSGVYLAGQTYQMDDVSAVSFVDGGYAEWVKPPQQEVNGDAVGETAMLEPEVEKAIRPRHMANVKHGKKHKGA